jgi:phytoene synthase
MSHEMNELSQASMKKGSKTFSLAARFFPQDEFESAAKIYFWCRSCDDYIDDQVASEEHVEELLQKTFQHQPTPEFIAFKEIRDRYQIPDLYPRELLEGMRMDVKNEKYKTIKDLELYAYRVAGTVGLMMSHVMGIYHEKALFNAAQLGMAMQMTNIARDVKEDEERGRVYLPTEWLNEGDTFEAVTKVLSHAEDLYQKGLEGLIELPLKSAFAVTMAAAFYREIGREILLLGPAALQTRVVISKERKAVLIFQSILKVLSSLPLRWMSKRELVSIKSQWRPV